MNKTNRSASLQVSRFTHKICDDENKLRRLFYQIRKQQEPEIESQNRKNLQQDLEVLTQLKVSQRIPHSTRVIKSASASMIKVRQSNQEPPQLRIKRFIHKIMSKQCQLDKDTQLLQQKSEIKKDLLFLNQISLNGLQSFTNRVGLYQKYYSQQLMDPQNVECRLEDLNIGLNPYTGSCSRKISTTSFRKILQYPIKAEKNNLTDTRAQLQNLLIDPQKQQKVFETYQQIIQRVEPTIMNLEEQEFLDMVKKGDFDGMRDLFRNNNKLISIRDNMMETPLHWAVKRNFLDLTEFLLQNKADTLAQDFIRLEEHQELQLNISNIIKSQNYQMIIRIRSNDEYFFNLKKTSFHQSVP